GKRKSFIGSCLTMGRASKEPRLRLPSKSNRHSFAGACGAPINQHSNDVSFAKYDLASRNSALQFLGTVRFPQPRAVCSNEPNCFVPIFVKKASNLSCVNQRSDPRQHWPHVASEIATQIDYPTRRILFCQHLDLGL